MWVKFSLTSCDDVAFAQFSGLLEDSSTIVYFLLTLFCNLLDIVAGFRDVIPKTAYVISIGTFLEQWNKARGIKMNTYCKRKVHDFPFPNRDKKYSEESRGASVLRYPYFDEFSVNNWKRSVKKTLFHILLKTKLSVSLDFTFFASPAALDDRRKSRISMSASKSNQVSSWWSISCFHQVCCMQMQAYIQSASARLNLIAPSRYRRQDNCIKCCKDLLPSRSSFADNLAMGNSTTWNMASSTSIRTWSPKKFFDTTVNWWNISSAPDQSKCWWGAGSRGESTRSRSTPSLLTLYQIGCSNHIRNRRSSGKRARSRSTTHEPSWATAGRTSGTRKEPSG